MGARLTKLRTGIAIAGVILGVYGLLAYVLLPMAWTHYEHQKRLQGHSMVTHTSQGIPGGPLNVGLVGAKEDVVCAMHAAGWYPADPITFGTSLQIIGSVVLDRPYPDAPVSNLYYLGRREDMAFEKPHGMSADQRYHVRFWEVLKDGDEHRSVWLGSVTFDSGIELSRYTGQVTHRIAADIDAARDLLTHDLETARVVEAIYEVSGIGPTLSGRNGEGNTYFTDGEIKISRLVEGCKLRSEPAILLNNPPVVEIKNVVWKNIAQMFRLASN
jgi:hypothetical protein